MVRTPLTNYPLDELVALARRQSPFYQQLYSSVPEQSKLEDLPVLEPASYWGAQARHPRETLTDLPIGGAVLSSGGSTGAPKFSYFNDEELDSAAALISLSLEGTGMRNGDRVANLFAAGYMFASFVLVMQALKDTPVKVLQLPIGYFVQPADAVRLLRGFQVNVWAGVPTHMMGIIDYILKEKVEGVRPERILFAGEPLTTEQRKFIEGCFPGVQISSMGYASVDGGVIGIATADCGPGEHRVIDGSTLVEIHEEDTGEVIEEPGRPGKIIFTNLTRRLMPMLRYPTGDRGLWLEPVGTPRRKFQLLGRAEESARVAIFNFPVSEVEKLLETFRAKHGIRQFQLLVTQEQLRDRLTLRLVSVAPEKATESASQEISDFFMRQKPVFAELVQTGVVWPMQVAWIAAEQLEVNPRSGKARMVVDRRVE